MGLDPRKQYVPAEYSSLAADMVATTKQNLKYWDSIKVPFAPSNRIAFEELRQIAVFLPLIPVAATLLVSKTAAAFLFMVALPIMRSLHRKMQRDMDKKWKEWLERDQGRYAFTEFMCCTFNLRPEDVDMELVYKLCFDFKTYVDAKKRLEIGNSGASRVELQKRGEVEQRVRHTTENVGVRTGERLENRGSEYVVTADDNHQHRINPATGLPMIDEVFDIHANTFGTSNMEDFWSGTDNNGFAGGHFSVDYADSGHANFSNGSDF